MRSASLVLVLTGLVAAASAQQIFDRGTLNSLLTSSTSDDFERYSIVAGGADSLGTPILDSTTIANSQGPGLVNFGATYSDGSGVQLQWNGDSYYGLVTKTLLANGYGGMIRIDYAGSVQAMGLDARAFAGYAYSGFMDVFNGSTVVGSVAFSLTSGGSESEFLGYQNAGGITHVEISSTNYGWSPIIDDHTYGTVPEPFTLTVLAGASLAFFGRRRRK